MGSSRRPDETEEEHLERHGVVVSPEQKRYSTYLHYGAWLGIGVMLLSYMVYLFGIVDPYVPMERLTEYWAMSSEQYLARAGVPSQWGWVVLVGHGDFLNFAGIALMGLLTVGGLLMLLPAYMRKRDWPFVLIVLLQILVLGASISGVLTRLT
jgi:hypothetical protein